MYFHHFFILSLMLILTACEDMSSTRGICNKHPEFCADLNTDGWCRYERTDVIKQRYQTSLLADGKNKYQLLITLEVYRDCIERASRVQFSKDKQRASGRTEGYLAALAQIEQLTKETKGDTTPDLLYYHWSREGDQHAFELLLEQDKKGQLEHPDIQLQLAGYYAKNDPQLAVNKLYKALYLSTGPSELDESIITMLATIFTQQHRSDLAYLWLKIGELAEIKSIDIEASSRYLLLNTEQRQALDKQAEMIYKTIEKGQFSLPEPRL